MAIAADHEGRTRRPLALFVEAPRNLDSLHGFAALAARRRGAGDQFRSVHGLSSIVPIRLFDYRRTERSAAMDVGPESTRRCAHWRRESPPGRLVEVRETLVLKRQIA